MRYLLDTHTVLWLAENYSRLSRIAARTILDTNNTMYISIASAWEVAIKCALNKLRLEGGVSEFFKVKTDLSCSPLKNRTWNGYSPSQSSITIPLTA